VPLYRARFTTPEAWSVELIGPSRDRGTRAFLIAGGRLSARLRGANYRRRRDRALTGEV
jgi:hypothetical protein